MFYSGLIKVAGNKVDPAGLLLRCLARHSLFLLQAVVIKYPGHPLAALPLFSNGECWANLRLLWYWILLGISKMLLAAHLTLSKHCWLVEYLILASILSIKFRQWPKMSKLQLVTSHLWLTVWHVWCTFAEYGKENLLHLLLIVSKQKKMKKQWCNFFCWWHKRRNTIVVSRKLWWQFMLAHSQNFEFSVRCKLNLGWKLWLQGLPHNQIMDPDGILQPTTMRVFRKLNPLFLPAKVKTLLTLCCGTHESTRCSCW